MPVIAAIHGNCFGGGLQIALGADIRIAAPDARLSVMEIKWGLIPDMSITRTLPRLVGIDVAKELTYTGRVLGGDRGPRARAGDPRGRRPARGRAGARSRDREQSPDAIRGAKRLFDELLDRARPTRRWRSRPRSSAALIGSPNQLAAVTAGMPKQPAEFTDPL